MHQFCHWPIKWHKYKAKKEVCIFEIKNDASIAFYAYPYKLRKSGEFFVIMMHTHYYSRSVYHVYILLATLAETRMEYNFFASLDTSTMRNTIKSYILIVMKLTNKTNTNIKPL